ncbi:MAG TPA: hypothetical protein VN803_04475 [Gemmatimonadales bacterium]|nr:hypothetical protein [Gemmatimonadales bacterium]
MRSSLRHPYLLGALALLGLSVACRLDMLIKPSHTPQPLLTVAPIEIQDTARAHSNDVRTAEIAITNGGGGTFSWSASDRSDWIKLDPHEGDAPGTLTVSLDPEDLGPGVYQGEVIVIARTTADSQVTTIAVTFVVQRPGLNVTPLLIDRSTNVGSNQIFNETIQVSNSGTGQLSWTASEDAAWLTLGATSGTGDASIPVTINSSGLGGGTYRGEIDVTAPGAMGSPQHVTVTLIVFAPGLAVTPGFIQERASTGSTTPIDHTLSVTNSGNGTITWSATKTQPWLTLSKASGGAPESITVTLNPTGLPAGIQTDTIVFTSPEAPTGPVRVPVDFTIATPGLDVTPPSVSATAEASDPKRQQIDLNVTNSAGGPLAWFASADAPWINVDRAGIAPSRLTVELDPRDLGPGPHNGTVTVTSPGAAGSPFVVPVQLVITTPPCGDIPLEPDVVRTSPVDKNDCEAPHRPGSFANVYSLSALAGDTLVIRFTAQFDAYLILTDGVGNVLAQNDECPGESGTACIPEFIITADGRYLIEGTSTLPGETGQVTITVIRKRTPPPGGSPPRQQ